MILQISLRITAASERQSSTIQDDKPSFRGRGTSRQVRRPENDKVWPAMLVLQLSAHSLAQIFISDIKPITGTIKDWS